MDLICKFLFQSGIPSKATQIGVIYEDFKSLTMSSPSFSKSIKHAIIMQEKSGLMEKWPWTSKKSTKGLLKNEEVNLNYAMLSQCKNVIEHYSWSIDSYLSMTHHKPSSLNLQCLSSCSNLVSIPKNLRYNYFKTGAD